MKIHPVNSEDPERGMLIKELYEVECFIMSIQIQKPLKKLITKFCLSSNNEDVTDRLFIRLYHRRSRPEGQGG